MSTISGLIPPTTYPYTGTAAVAAIPSSSTAPSVTRSQQNGNFAAPLTYNAAGLLNAAGQTTQNSAQSALLAVQNAIAQTQSSLLSGISPSSNTAGSSLFNAPPGAAAGSFTPQTTGNTIQTAKNAYFAAEEAVNQAFSSIA